MEHQITLLKDLEHVLLKERDVGRALEELKPVTARIFEVGGYNLAPYFLKDVIRLYEEELYPDAESLFNSKGYRLHKLGGYTFIYSSIPDHKGICERLIYKDKPKANKHVNRVF